MLKRRASLIASGAGTTVAHAVAMLRNQRPQRGETAARATLDPLTQITQFKTAIEDRLEHVETISDQ